MLIFYYIRNRPLLRS